MSVGWSRTSPFLRLLLPLAVGIAAGDRFPCAVEPWVWAVVGLLPLTVYALSRHHTCRRLFDAAACLFLLFTGFTLAGWQWQESAFPYRDSPAAAYRVRLVERPQEKERSLLLRAVLLGKGGEAAAQRRYLQKPCLLYFPKDTAAAMLGRGDELWIQARLAPPGNGARRTEAFDYARYLRRKGICAGGYVPEGNWRVTAHNEARTLRQRAADLRGRVVDYYRYAGFEGDELAVLSALTVGYKETLDRELKETYALTGAAHVLALSGLHTGFLYALLLFLFAPLWHRWRKLKLPLMACVLLLLWTFVLTTGLSTSMVRAAVMCSFSLVSLLQHHKPFTMNLLAAASFGMLLFRPLWLFDVGFQLSFSAVAGIVWLQPKLYGLWQAGHPLQRSLWSLATLSVAAQAGTLPLSIYYFSRFPTYFLLTNLWVVPMVTLVMYGGVLLLVLAPFPVWVHALASLLKPLLWWQNTALRHIGRLPCASIEGIHWDAVEVGLCYLCLFLWARWLLSRSAANLTRALAVVLLFVAYHTVTGLLAAPG
ncbi:MAG: ComEC family competence protein [Prevotellaceae bacterium]|nr:ComEC family competence protein [Prevotellaceae bacterium]